MQGLYIGYIGSHPHGRQDCFLLDEKEYSEVLAWEINFYLTQAVMQGLYIGYIGTHPHGRQDCYIRLRSRHHVMSHFNIFRNFRMFILK